MGCINSVTFSPNGQQILTGWNNFDHFAVLWDTQGNKLKEFAHSDDVNSVSFSPNGQQILTGSNDKTAKLYNLKPFQFPVKTRQYSGSLTSDEVATMARLGMKVRYEKEEKAHAISVVDILFEIEKFADGNKAFTEIVNQMGVNGNLVGV
ncbi:MAG: hypothetical protein CSA09_04780 [Candidatus Contendobacter odensis]|uniref:Uncharacterized protein n=1 Tax=Candidatus Contendibacter odensensis TaxID=1400860 RepID=A0A2G6PEE1_9GAMM|nr:MAG: hypothetical protein CSA09_04780 [Candidatus Contendobacter odensis]